MNFAHFCEFWCFSSGKQARFTLNFCSGMPLRKVHELTFLWFGLPGPLLMEIIALQAVFWLFLTFNISFFCDLWSKKAGKYHVCCRKHGCLDDKGIIRRIADMPCFARDFGLSPFSLVFGAPKGHTPQKGEAQVSPFSGHSCYKIWEKKGHFQLKYGSQNGR